MHNLVLTNLEIWDPNLIMGDMQLMALASWMINEDTRAKDIWKVMGRRNREPLYIIPEFFSPRGVILNSQEIERDPALVESYLQTQTQVIYLFDDVSRQLEDDCIMASQRRWNNLPHSLKNREYHIPEILRGA